MILNTFSSLKKASMQSARSLISLILEIIILRFGRSQLGISEYIDTRLYLNDLTLIEKKCFIGWRTQNILEEILVDDYSKFQSMDKITMYAILKGYGLPIPEIRAVYLSHRPTTLLQFYNPQSLAAFLHEQNATPLYIKPSLGSYGRGNTLVSSASNGILILGDGSAVNAIDFCKSLSHRHGLGWILQEPLRPHRSIAEVCGEKISGIRIHTFLTNLGVKIIKAIWKINVGKDDSDNFQHGASGNMLAALNIETGRVIRVVSGVGNAQIVKPVHPITGVRFDDFCIPWWNEIKALVCDAQLAFPGFICPGWDIAVCDDGPKILEVNFFGDVDLSQHAYRIGFLDDEFIKLMQSRDLIKVLNGPIGARKRSSTTQRMGLRKQHWKW